MNQSGTAPPILENVPLAPYTTLGIGGPARFMLKAKTEEHILDAMEFARARSCRVFVLGGGSNIVASDSGFQGLVIKIEIEGIRINGNEKEGRISAAAGVSWDRLVQFCVDRDLAGIECLSGIPGTAGGAPIQNVNAYGQDVSEVITRIVVFDRDASRIFELSNTDCCFAYRSSVFNTTHKDRYIILRVDFAFHAGGHACVQYEDVKRKFAGCAQEPKIADVREAVLQIRKTKGMLLSDDNPDSRSVGSFFKNPVLSRESVDKLEAEARSRGILKAIERIPRYAAWADAEKLPAAWLIEHAGFHKGYIHKNAGISSKHALAFINRGNATSKDIVELMHLIQNRVRDLFGVELLPEPVFVGFE